MGAESHGVFKGVLLGLPVVRPICREVGSRSSTVTSPKRHSRGEMPFFVLDSLPED
jgi:acyl-CoA synthetase (AMP-forming)/AMP-acid ligase II